MREQFFLLAIVAFLTTTGCSNREREAQLEKRISELESSLDECLHGADKILASIKIEFEKENFHLVKSKYSEIEKRHPQSPEFAEAKQIYEKVISIEEERKKEAERKIERERQERLRALNKLRKNHDDVSGVTWYKQPYFTHYTNTNLTSIYLGDNGSRQWLRLMMSYKGNDWIFFDKAYLSYEGNTKEIRFNEYSDKKTEIGSGSVWEWIDVSITSDVESFLREFAKSRDAKMRLSGKYTRTRNLTNNERQGILDVLNGYDALRNN